MDEAAEEVSTAPSVQPSEVAGGPKGLAFVALRTELKKLETKLESTQSLLEATRSEANAAANAAGAAIPTQRPPGISLDTSGDGAEAMAQLRVLEEFVEDRMALITIQLESLGGGCPCIDGRCPCACSKGGAPLREPPKKKNEAEGEDEFDDELNVPWKKLHGKKDHGGGS